MRTILFVAQIVAAVILSGWIIFKALDTASDMGRNSVCFEAELYHIHLNSCDESHYAVKEAK